MIHKRQFVRLLSFWAVCLLASCTGIDFSETDGEERALLQPVEGGSLLLAESRSIVNGTAPSAATDKINTIRVYLANTDNSSYSGIASDGEVFTLQSNGTTWASTTPVYVSIKQNLYACSPSDLVVTYNNAGKHTVPVSITGAQTFDGANTWNCSNTDYLYGSASKVVGQATQIVASRENPSPAIYLQHALSQIVFNMENASGRVPDPDYDYVKSVTLKADASATPFYAGNATMQLNDGTLAFTPSPVGELKFTPSANTVRVGNAGTPVTVAYGLVAPRTAFSGKMTLTIVLGKLGETTTERELSVPATDVFNGAWEKGKRYEYKISLSDRGITISGASIKGWAEVKGSADLLPDRE